jgi:hypothetical protein
MDRTLLGTPNGRCSVPHGREVYSATETTVCERGQRAAHDCVRGRFNLARDARHS